jgi:hypothetical protein
LTPTLRRQIAAIGEPRWIIAPNRYHYWWVPEWRDEYPAAEIHVAPRVRAQAKSHIVFPTIELEGALLHPWEGEIATLAVPGSFVTEFTFFHIASRTLILADLIENYEYGKLASSWQRFLSRLGAVQDPDGQTPRDLRLSFARRRAAVREAAETMIGRWYQADAVIELRRALRWVLGTP